MIFSLILIIVFGILALTAIGTLIYGVVKKKRSLIITAVVLFVVSAVGGAVSGFVYAKKVYNYVRSDDFQKDAESGAALVGETAGSVSSGVSKGLATTLSDEAITALAQKSATIFGKSIKTAVSSLDSTLGSKHFFMDESLAESGFVLGRAEERNNSGKSELGVFITYNKDFTGKLRITNYDQTGKKIDIAEKQIAVKAGEEKVETFIFPQSQLGLTTYYILSQTE